MQMSILYINHFYHRSLDNFFLSLGIHNSGIAGIFLAGLDNNIPLRFIMAYLGLDMCVFCRFGDFFKPTGIFIFFFCMCFFSERIIDNFIAGDQMRAFFARFDFYCRLDYVPSCTGSVCCARYHRSLFYYIFIIFAIMNMLFL